MTNFNELNLSAKILDALTKKGYTTPTPIQSRAIPHLLEGRDFLGIAQTGTGKTAAFSLPILDNLSKSNIKVESSNVRALILTPTRELASQIIDNIKLYGKDLGFKHSLIFGGVNINGQIRNIKQGNDIIVATPGRLIDLINQKYLKFSQLEILVLDEADRMLDMGFIHDVRKIITKIPSERQTLFFSATMPKDVGVLANAILKDPVKVEITPESTTVEKIDQRINFVEKGNKPPLLKSIIKENDENSILVFSRTKHGANRIVSFLEESNIKAAAIHGNKSQAAREKALNEFRLGNIKILVATDIAARGIDIPGITHVINYDIPEDSQNYVHRIGRTARAGKGGIAISFCDNSEKSFLRDIEKIIKIKIPVDESHKFHNVESSTSYKDDSRRDSNLVKTRNTNKKSGSRAKNNREPSYFSQTRGRKSQNSKNIEGRINFSGDSLGEKQDERKKRSDFKSSNSTRFYDNDNQEKSFNNKRSSDSDSRFAKKPSRFSSFKGDKKVEKEKVWEKGWEKDRRRVGARNQEEGERGNQNSRFGNDETRGKVFHDRTRKPEFITKKEANKQENSNNDLRSKSADRKFGNKKFGDKKTSSKSGFGKRFGDKKLSNNRSNPKSKNRY